MIQEQVLTRVFAYNGIQMADPAPERSVEHVKTVLGRIYPEILNSVAEGPVMTNGQAVYTLTRSVGTKG